MRVQIGVFLVLTILISVIGMLLISAYALGYIAWPSLAFGWLTWTGVWMVMVLIIFHNVLVLNEPYGPGYAGPLRASDSSQQQIAHAMRQMAFNVSLSSNGTMPDPSIVVHQNPAPRIVSDVFVTGLTLMSMWVFVGMFPRMLSNIGIGALANKKRDAASRPIAT